ncbi:uncharacterized protein Z519_09115 [Cladophialophora bantiana CBS 173.52]|uniref:Heterokaryon incompatibility domain-containing protein n=1 Tax=Cladophialophora bantiana (strain ATCC 10958 / CBS 173.52 / CDC B-1940 / NIH 8579) TaxID=1442370 RepID=A0A0D2I0V9_CLAB1|nr:uncharacterized protein Z519_09115 [Cladophialophora bantiana CBS 173.52]KIW90469.1 hypothetical protein Z519_09115 [Cladophialophora bantiana CBS 173.52]
MDTLRQENANGDFDRLCDSQFCQFLAALQFDPALSAFDVMGQALSRRFPHVMTFYELEIGTLQTIAARDHCPSCRFALTILESCAGDRGPPDTTYFASFPKTHLRFSLAHHKPNGRAHYLMSKFGEQITFLANDSVRVPEAGRLVDPKGVDYQRMRSWLALCEQLHDVCPATATGKSPHRLNLLPHLRVVDVQEMCLTDIPWTEKYVALSYVWGGATPPRLLKHELDMWKTPGSIRCRADTFPRTIRDSLEVVTKLNLRYFWFDSLCLLQDDLEDLRKSINNMDMIYERAYVTIVAANSPSADGGLPGVGSSRTPNQMIQHIKPGISLINIAPLDAHLKTSVWSTRGWTLQEQHLSRRTMNFVNGQVYFRCRQRIWSEDLCRDLAPRSQNPIEWATNYIALAREGMDEMEYLLQPYDFLFSALEEFQKRNITMDSDALNAMAGFLQRVAEAGKTAMIEGLPVKLLPVAMIFRNRADNPDLSPDVRRRSDFPSWSWAGWRAPSFWDYWKEIDVTEGEGEILDWLTGANWITWSVSKDGGAPEVFHDPSTIRNQFFADEGDRAKGDDMHRPATAHVERSIPPPFEQMPWAFREQAPKIPPDMPYPLLIFRTVVIRMAVAPPGPDSDSYCLFSILDNTGSSCGEVIPDFIPESPNTDTNDRATGAEGDAGADAEAHTEATRLPPEHPLFEFLLLSERHHKPNLTAAAPGDDDYDDAVANFVEKNTYWVMMVEFLPEKAVYERRGIGHVLKTLVLEGKTLSPGPEWREIVLA